MANSLILNSLEIQNFRLFRHLRIERLGRVNLIVGQNNIGKTCLLEALWVYAHRGELAAIWELLEARGESIHYSTAYSRSVSPSASNAIVNLNDLQNIFHKRVGIKSNPKPIQIGPTTDVLRAQTRLNNPDLEAKASQTLCLRVELFAERVNEQGQLQVQRLSPENAHKTPNSIPVLSAYFGKEIAYTQRLDYSSLLSQASQNTSGNTCIFVPANGLRAKQISKLWDEISQK